MKKKLIAHRISFSLTVLIILIGSVYGAVIWDETRTDFIVSGENPFCFHENETFYWNDGGDIIPSFEDCYRIDGEPSMNCCPEQHSCQQIGEAYKCVPQQRISLCSHYNTSESCEKFSQGVANYNIESLLDINGFCNRGYSFFNSTTGCLEYVQGCFCEWTNNTCAAAYDTNEACPDGGGSGLKSAKCTITPLQTTNCTDGKMHTRWNAYSSTQSGNKINCTSNINCAGYIYLGRSLTCQGGNCVNEICKPGEREIICPSEIMLSFVSWTGIILAVILLVLFYLIFRNKKKANKKRKR